jgi:hypothetical protein
MKQIYTVYVTFVIHVSKRVFSCFMLPDDQTFPNIIIWRESRFETVFSTNSL